jgi:hypothetical protein
MGVLRRALQKVMLDTDLAALYTVETRQLVRAVKRNIELFLQDFALQLTAREFTDLRRQTGTSKSWGGQRTPFWAITEQGMAMLSSVLCSKTTLADRL